MITINVLNKDMSDSTPVKLSAKEFWKIYLSLRSENLTPKEIDVLSDFYSGSDKPIKGNYKKYVERLREKGLNLSKQELPKNLTLQINATISE